jgi:BMFP domain-containing protein YqiC
MNSLAKEGKQDAEEGMKMKEDMENRMVEGIVEVVGGALKKVGVAKKEVDAVLGSLAEDVAERLKIVTMDDLDVVEKLVMVNREKVSKLEKQVKKLEKALLDLSAESDKG